MEFRYRFAFPDKTVYTFAVEVDDATLSLKHKPRKHYPEWTALGYHRCEHCTLKESEHPRCPAATALLEVVEHFHDCKASQTVDIEIETQRRTYSRKGPLAVAMTSMVAVSLPTCGCPVLDKLRPMVFTHLPFASLEQNLNRQLAYYMLAQYFRARKGLKPDMDLKGLATMSEDIHTVNRNLCKRISSACPKDAAVNAVVHLDCFAGNATLTLKRKGLSQFEKHFAAFLKD
jgi:hypothetical protein